MRLCRYRLSHAILEIVLRQFGVERVCRTPAVSSSSSALTHKFFSLSLSHCITRSRWLQLRARNLGDIFLIDYVPFCGWWRDEKGKRRNCVNLIAIQAWKVMYHSVIMDWIVEWWINSSENKIQSFNPTGVEETVVILKPDFCVHCAFIPPSMVFLPLNQILSHARWFFLSFKPIYGSDCSSMM